MIQPPPHGMIKYMPADAHSAENLLRATFKVLRKPVIISCFSPVAAEIFTSFRKGNGL